MIIDELIVYHLTAKHIKNFLINLKNFQARIQAFGSNSFTRRRTGDQKDQLGLAFDAIIDCADIEELIKEKVLVPAEYRSFFIHDLELEKMDISTGDFPIEQLSNAIIKILHD